MEESTGQFSSPNLSSTGEPESAFLSIRQQPPSHVFSDEAFEVDFSIEPARGSSDSPPTNVTIQVVLLSNAGIPAIEATLHVLEEPRISQSRRTGKVKCKIAHEHVDSFALRLFTKENILTPVTTRQIQIVQSKLKLTADNWNSVWYKDEGGRDKCMEVNAALYDANEKLVLEQIPLNLTLCYDHEEYTPLSNKEILRVLGPKQCVLENGKARIRFRVEDVSKNHQGQDFVLKAETDQTSIAPGYSESVSVRSKRNKRQRPSTHPDVPPSARAASAPQHSVQARALYGSETFQRPSLDVLDNDALREAVVGVVTWVEDVVNGLYPLQWSVLGYQQHPDGSPDYNRPYHSMPNPNPLISRALSSYSESTRGYLRVLEQAVMGPNSAISAGSYASSGHGDSPFPHPNLVVHGPPSDAPYGMPMMYGRQGMPMGQPAMPIGPQLPLGMGRPGPPPMDFPTYFPRGPRQDEFEESEPLSVAAPSAQGQVPAAQASGRRETGVLQSSALRESEVEYVLAKQYKSLRTGERLGFPAYSSRKEILGFYRESKVGNQYMFVPVSRSTADYDEIVQQATDVLQEAMDSKNEAVHALRDWGSISNLIDHALVYEWSKDISSGSSGSGNRNNRSSGDPLV